MTAKVPLRFRLHRPRSAGCCCDNADQFAGGDVVGFQPQRVDDHLDHFVAVTGERGLKHGFQCFQAVLQVFGHAQQGAFGHVRRSG